MKTKILRNIFITVGGALRIGAVAGRRHKRWRPEFRQPALSWSLTDLHELRLLVQRHRALWFFEIARLLVRLNYVARFIVNADHTIGELHRRLVRRLRLQKPQLMERFPSLALSHPAVSPPASQRRVAEAGLAG